MADRGAVSALRAPLFMSEAEYVREQRDLERDDRRQEADDAHHRMERDAYYPAPTSGGSDDV